MQPNIAIIGAGLVGSLLAAQLGQRGHKVTLYERSSDMRAQGFIGGRSINLALSTRGIKALSLAGLDQAALQMALPMKSRMMHSRQGDLTEQAYGADGQAINSISRSGLNIMLLNAAEEAGVELVFNAPCSGIDLRTGEISLGDQSLITDVVIGADGAFSSLRNSLMKRQRFNYQQRFLEHGYKELRIPPAADGSHQLSNQSLHIWPREQFMLIALPNLDGSFTCTLFMAFEGEQNSFDSIPNAATAEQFFKQYFADALDLMPTFQADWDDNPTSPLVTVRCDPWAYQAGKTQTLLIGDASHAIVPFYGQGMNSGFEDTTLLVQAIEEHNGDWKAAIAAFDATRYIDANAIADLALRNYIEMRDQVADPDFLLRKKMAARFQKLEPQRFIPMYSQVTFSHLPYSKALAGAHAQDELFEQLLNQPNIHDEWESTAVDAEFRAWLDQQD